MASPSLDQPVSRPGSSGRGGESTDHGSLSEVVPQDSQAGLGLSTTHV